MYSVVDNAGKIVSLHYTKDGAEAYCAFNRFVFPDYDLTIREEPDIE